MSEIARIGSMQPGHHGAEGTGVSLSRATIASAWNVQGSPASTSILAECMRLFGVELPLSANGCVSNATLLALWLGPRSWLLVESGSPSSAQQRLQHFDSCRDAINTAGGALFDVSASRVAYGVRGEHATTVLAAGCPLDFDARVFLPGSCAQSMLGRIGALIYRHQRAPAFSVMVATSLALDAWRGLCLAAAAEGYDVTAPAALDPR